MTDMPMDTGVKQPAPTKNTKKSENPALRLHKDTIDDLALAIGGILESAEKKMALDEDTVDKLVLGIGAIAANLDDSVCQTIAKAVVDGFREVIKDALPKQEPIPISAVRLYDTVRVGSEEGNINVAPPKFKRYKLSMEWSKGLLWVRWEDGNSERKTLIIHPSNIRDMTPLEALQNEEDEKAPESAA